MDVRQVAQVVTAREPAAGGRRPRGRLPEALRAGLAWWPLAAALAVGALLRFWGIASGVPHAVNVDEPVIVSIALRMMRTGDLSPHFFDYPTLYIYVQLATACVRFLAGAAQGLWTSLDQAGIEHFYLWGRVVTATLGVATIGVVFAAGSHYGRVQAGLAAAVVAVFPLHVRESHYVLTDVPATFFVALALWFSLRAAHAPTARGFALAGAAAGLAAATKYNAGLALIMPLVAVYGSGAAPRLRHFGAAIGAAAAAFLLSAPYTVLELPVFLNAFGNLATYYRERPGAEPGWSVYLKHLRMALAWPAFLLLFAGLLHALVAAFRRAGGVRWWLATLFPIVYFFFVSRQGLIFGRYLMPLTPFVALLVAFGVVRLADWARRAGDNRTRAWIAAALTVMVIVPQGTIAVAFNRAISHPTTTRAAYDWIVGNLPDGSAVTIENLTLHLPEKRYRTIHVRRLSDRDLEAHRDAGAQYLVASSYEYGPFLSPHSPDMHVGAAYQRLFSQALEILRVSPSPSVAGPEIRVYAVE